MTEEFKNKLVENLQWLEKQTGKKIRIVDKLSTNKGNYDRHFTRTSEFNFVIVHFGVALSGAIGNINGENVQFEFKTDMIKRIERKGNILEFESELNTNTSRLITFEIERPGDNTR